MERSTFSWREREFLALLVIVFLGYFVGIDYPGLRGEESRRAQVAVEILHTGDWIVPRQQGMPFLSRPPAGSWPIAVLGWLRGDVDVAAARLPSLVCILLTSLLCYIYARQFLSPVGALAAGAGFATMAQVLQLGRLAETEAIFTFFVSGSLLVWHGGHMKNPRAAWPWIAGYALAALGTLTKGPQAPVYFGAAVAAYLLWQRQWRTLFSWQHALGIATFLLLFGAWLVPFAMQVGLRGVRATFAGDVGLRFVDLSPRTIAVQLLTFPLQTLAVMLPWSFVLVGYALPSLRANLGYARPWIRFALVALCVSFPTVWLAPLATTRYYMPLFPLAAVLGAVVFEQRAWQTQEAVFWEWTLKLAATTLLAASGGVVALALFQPGLLVLLAVPVPFALAFAAVASAIAAALIGMPLHGRGAARRQVLCLALVMLAANGLVYLPNLHARSIDNAAEVAEARELLGDEKLVSFDYTHHLFAFYYKRPITLLPWPDSQPERHDFTYFCYSTEYYPHMDLPFPWEVVKVVNCDRARYARPKLTVVIGKRLAKEGPPPHAMTQQDAMPVAKASNALPALGE
jgi:4-amino-4-deoxy-L-arabinose transferase-like glycosyltransferase